MSIICILSHLLWYCLNYKCVVCYLEPPAPAISWHLLSTKPDTPLNIVSVNIMMTIVSLTSRVEQRSTKQGVCLLQQQERALGQIFWLQGTKVPLLLQLLSRGAWEPSSGQGTSSSSWNVFWKVQIFYVFLPSSYESRRWTGRANPIIPYFPALAWHEVDLPQGLR